jgi:hypothetical protein
MNSSSELDTAPSRSRGRSSRRSDSDSDSSRSLSRATSASRTAASRSRGSSPAAGSAASSQPRGRSPPSRARTRCELAHLTPPALAPLTSQHSGFPPVREKLTVTRRRGAVQAAPLLVLPPLAVASHARAPAAQLRRHRSVVVVAHHWCDGLSRVPARAVATPAHVVRGGRCRRGRPLEVRRLLGDR